MEFAISQPKVVRLPRNEKQTYWLNFRPQMWPIGLTLTITLTFEFFRSNMTFTFDHTQDLDHGSSWSNFEICISEWEGRLTFYKGGGSRSFMTMTIWWPRSGVWIYQIVTGGTLVVAVPSTNLVVSIECVDFDIKHLVDWLSWNHLTHVVCHSITCTYILMNTLYLLWSAMWHHPDTFSE